MKHEKRVQQWKKFQECADDEKLKFSSIFLLFRYFFVVFFFILWIIFRLRYSQTRTRRTILSSTWNTRLSRCTFNRQLKAELCGRSKAPKKQRKCVNIFSLWKKALDRRCGKFTYSSTKKRRESEKSERAKTAFSAQSSRARRFPSNFCHPTEARSSSSRIVTSQARRQVNRHQQHRKTTTKVVDERREMLKCHQSMQGRRRNSAKKQHLLLCELDAFKWGIERGAEKNDGAI